jgi:hypothetical protein
MKCIVKDCENHVHQGNFVGAICSPCNQFLTTGEGKYSQLYRNTVAAEREACIKLLEDFSQTQMVPVLDTWRMGLIAGANAIRARGQG